jgi:hypothetical protein
VARKFANGGQYVLVGNAFFRQFGNQLAAKPLLTVTV